MKILSKIVLGLIGLLVLAVGAVGAVVAFVDINAYRAPLAEAVSRQLGRVVQLDGSIGWSVSLTSGLALSVHDLTVANASWAGKDPMATIGTVELGVGILPLLQKKVEVSAFRLSQATIRLATNAQGEGNWSFDKKKADAAKPVSEATAGNAPPVSFDVRHVAVDDTTIVFQKAGAVANTIKVESLSLDSDGQGMTLAFRGEAQGTDIALDLTGGALDAVMGPSWPFDATLEAMGYTVAAKGALKDSAKMVDLAALRVQAGDSAIDGALTVALGGARPVVRGALQSKRFDPADFKPKTSGHEAESDASASGAKGSASSKRVFSDAPIPFDGLKAADAHVDLSIGSLPVGMTELQNLRAKIDLEAGRLLISPLQFTLADSQAEGQVRVDASAQPARLSTIFKANQIDLSKLVQIGGMNSFINGKGDVTFDLNSIGRSAHDFAANMTGRARVITEGGSLSEGVLAQASSGLLDLFLPGAGSLTKGGLNCLAARMNIVDGKMMTDGVLLDTPQATAAVTGKADLGEETLDFVVQAQPKIDVVGGYVPPVRIRGTLAAPSYKADVSGTVQKVAGLLGGSALGGGTGTGVPKIITQNGANACVYTLDHPEAQPKTEARRGLVQDQIEKARDTVKDLGGKVLNDLGGKLFGQ